MSWFLSCHRVGFATFHEGCFRDVHGFVSEILKGVHGIVFEALYGVRSQGLHEVLFETPEIRDVQLTCVLQYVQLSAPLWSGIWSVSPALLSAAFSITSRGVAWHSRFPFFASGQTVPLGLCGSSVAAVGVTAGGI